MPAASTTRRSWSSPHCPRTFGERRACTSRPVSVCSVCCARCSERSCSVSADALPTRFFSTSCSLTSTLPSESLSGCTRSSMALCRPSRSILAVCWNSVREAFARSRNDWLFRRRASDESAEKASRSFSSASLSSAELVGRRAAFGRELGFEARPGRGELGGELRTHHGHLALSLCPHDEPHADGEQQTKRDQADDDEGHETKFRRRGSEAASGII